MPPTDHDPVAHVRAVGLDPERLPRHIAIIMDGNGRWAVEKGLERVAGHARGADVVRQIVTECCKLGIQQLTLYCFSSENWRRPQPEIDFLMSLLKEYLLEERQLLLDQNIRFKIIGRREGLSTEVLEEMDRSINLTSSNTGLTLCLAINYSGRAEIVDAVRKLVTEAQAGTLDPATIDEEDVAQALYTKGMPDPDLLIRTAGELRVSNYLLWQISYAEIWVSQKCWPDFDSATLYEACLAFAQRNRRFGSLINLRGAVT